MCIDKPSLLGLAARFYLTINLGVRNAGSRSCAENPRNALPSITPPSVVAWLPHQADTRTGGNAMRWIYDAYGNADLDEVAFAEKCISAILENVDLSPAPRAATTSRCAFWGVW